MKEELKKDWVPAELVPYYCLLEAKRVPMSEELTEAYIRTFMAGSKIEEVRQNIVDDANGPLGFRIMTHRLAEGVEVESGAWFWAGFQCTSPGDAVMWAYTLSAISWLTGGQKITSDLLMMDDRLFAMGVPDLSNAHGFIEDIHAIWDAQKYREPSRKGTDNFLDYPDFWSIQKEAMWNKGLDILPRTTQSRAVATST